MKLQVTQENLSKALGSVVRVASTRGTLPILSNVLLKTVDGRLSIAATNLDIAITHYVGAKIETAGSITVPARLMQDFVSSLPGGVISLDLDDNKLHISAGKYQSVVNGISAEDYPIVPDVENGKSWTVGSKDLKQALQQVVFTASNDEARPVLTGVYWYSVGGELFLAATDSYRLAEKMLAKTDQEIDLLIPASSLNDLLRLINDFDGQVEVSYDEQQVLFRAGDVELVTRLIEGKYPDYKKLIPKEFATRAALSRAEMQNITKVSSLFARESAGSVTINVDAKEQQVSIRSIASQVGENTAAASAKVEGEGDITLNSRYIIDALHAFIGEEVELAFNGKLDPSVLRDPKDPSYVHIIMPLKS